MPRNAVTLYANGFHYRKRGIRTVYLARSHWRSLPQTSCMKCKGKRPIISEAHAALLSETTHILQFDLPLLELGSTQV